MLAMKRIFRSNLLNKAALKRGLVRLEWKEISSRGEGDVFDIEFGGILKTPNAILGLELLS